MTDTHPYWPPHGYPVAPHPHYPLLAPAHALTPLPGHHTYTYPHPYEAGIPHPAAAPAPAHYTLHYPNPPQEHHVHHHHHHFHHHPAPHKGHTLHIRMITVTVDITKVQWTWHVTDQGGTLVKSTTKIHETFEECIADAGRNGNVTIVSEHEDISKATTTWLWNITGHTGQPIKAAVAPHASFTGCINDARAQGLTIA
ncbi:MAG: hypothetical protein K9G33_04895 [Sneathiella sp.]|nr:hypothetical protein [Sneathiella sp.]